MNRSIAILICLLLPCFIVADSQAATDYNSSRSNKADGVAAEDLNNLLTKVTSDARRIGKKIIDVEADGDKDAKMLIKVTVKVEVCKITRACQTNQEAENNVKCECSHL